MRSALLFELARLYMKESDHVPRAESDYLHDTAIEIYERACRTQRQEIDDEETEESEVRRVPRRRTG